MTRSAAVDWEAELVVVIGTDCYEVAAAEGIGTLVTRAEGW